MLPKEDRKAMLLRLYNDETPLENNSKQRSKEKVEIRAEEIETEEAEEKDAPDRANTSSEDEALDAKVEADVEEDLDDGGVRLPDADEEREAEMGAGLATGHIDEKYAAEQMVKDAS